MSKRSQRILTTTGLFLVFVIFLVLAAGDEPEQVTPDNAATLFGGGNGGRSFVKYVDDLIDQMSAQTLRVSQEDILLWEIEVLPYFTYERVVNVPVVPESITLRAGDEGMWHNHILGQAQCADYEGLTIPKVVELNARTANPHSSWYGDADRFLPTLIHELTHIQGVCMNGEASETATQLITVEILAALVNHGNKEALYPFLTMLRGIGLSALYYEALDAEINEDDKDALAEYETFRDEILDSAIETARFEKAQRFWFQDLQHKGHLRYILKAYNYEVFTRLQEALENGRVDGLWIPYFMRNAGSLSDIQAKETYKGTRSFEMDDFVWLLPRLVELVEERV